MFHIRERELKMVLGCSSHLFLMTNNLILVITELDAFSFQLQLLMKILMIMAVIPFIFSTTKRSTSQFHCRETTSETEEPKSVGSISGLNFILSSQAQCYIQSHI